MLFLYDRLLVSSFHTNHTFCRPNSTCCVKHAVASIADWGGGGGSLNRSLLNIIINTGFFSHGFLRTNHFLH